MRLAVKGAIALASILAAAESRAAVLTTDPAAWAAAAGTYDTTTDFGFTNGAFVPTDANANAYVTLSDGLVLTLDTGQATFYAPCSTCIWPAVSNLTGQIVDGPYGGELTLSFTGIYALALDVIPDGGASGTVTATLSDGSSLDLANAVGDGTHAYFIGFYGGGITSLALTSSVTGGASDFSDFAFGDVRDVPEPMSLAILTAGWAALSVARRRRGPSSAA